MTPHETRGARPQRRGRFDMAMTAASVLSLLAYLAFSEGIHNFLRGLWQTVQRLSGGA
ncbi:MAG: hypothetical protein ACFB13_04520 [Kiloniellaceae bacterium]